MGTQHLVLEERFVPVAPAAPGGSVSPHRAARIAGASYVAMFVLAILAKFVVLERMIEPGNAAATVANIAESSGLFRLGVIGFLVIFLLDVVIAWALHVVLRAVDRDVSRAAAWFRLVYSAFLGLALVHLLQVIQLVGDGGLLGGVVGDAVNEQTMLALDAFDQTWRIGLAAFGVHLVLVGLLVTWSGYVSKALGMVLVVAGVAYAADVFAALAAPGYADVEAMFQAVVAVPSMIGEGWLGVWLLLTRRFAP